MQGAITSKFMFPCGRRVHLHRSACYKTIFEQLQTNHNKYANIDPTIIETIKYHLKKCWTQRKCYPTYAKCSDVGSHFGAICLPLSRCGRLFCDLFFGTSGRTSLGPIVASPAAPLVQFGLLFERLQEQTRSKIQRFQSNKWHHPPLQKNKQGFETTLPSGNPNKILFTFVV